jgi:hypothetical protein
MTIVERFELARMVLAGEERLVAEGLITVRDLEARRLYECRRLLWHWRAWFWFTDWRIWYVTVAPMLRALRGSHA